jgi:hypothetical protein
MPSSPPQISSSSNPTPVSAASPAALSLIMVEMGWSGRAAFKLVWKKPCPQTERTDSDPPFFSPQICARKNSPSYPTMTKVQTDHLTLFN